MGGVSSQLKKWQPEEKEWGALYKGSAKQGDFM